MKGKYLVIILVLLALAGVKAASAATCPTDDGAGTVCSGVTPYWCSGSCRSMAVAYCPVNSLTPVSPCAGLDTCGVCNSCIASYLLCTASAYPTRSCTYNNPANHCATLTNSNCTAGSCATCVSGYTRCASNNTCIATQSCETWETFNACTASCQGTAPTLKLGYDSVSGTNIIQSTTYPTLYIPSSGNVGIGTTAPGYLLDVNGLGNFSNFVYGLTPVETDDYALATVEYVNESLSLAGGGLWSGTTGGNIWNLNSGNVGIGTTNPVNDLQIGSATFTGAYGSYDNSRVGLLVGNGAGSSGMVSLQVSSTYNSPTTPNYGLVLVNGPSITSYDTWGIMHDGPANASGGLKFSYGAQGSNIHAVAPMVTFQKSGNVGIGTTNPGAKLQVSGHSYFNSTLSIGENRSDIGTLYVRQADSSGSVPVIRVKNEYNGGDTFIRFQGLNNSGAAIYSDLSFNGADQSFSIRNPYHIPRLTVLSGGNVGIGTTAPSVKLQVTSTTGGDGTWSQGLLIENTNATAGETAVSFKNISSGSNYWFLGQNQDADFHINYGTSFTDAGNKFYITTGGNVGIGTTAPGYVFDVSGLGNFDNFVYGSTPVETDDYALTTVEYVNSALSLAGGGLWSGTTGGNIWSLNSGNVGVGTTNPTARLYVTDTVANANPLEIFRSGSSNIGYKATNGDGFWMMGKASGGFFGISPDAADLNTASKLVITTTGNVGIGTTAPYSKLDVVGLSGITSFTGTSRMGATIRGTAASSEYSGLDFVGDTTNVGSAPIARIAMTRSGNGSYLQFGTSNSWASGITNQALTIDYSGKVGIGTTAPANKLEVYAGSDTSQILWGQNIKNEGNANLTGYGSGLKLKISSEIAGSEANKWIGLAAVAGASYANRVDLAIYATNNTSVAPVERVRIQGDGNVGIGTVSPDELLDVENGNIRLKSNSDGANGLFRIYDAAGVESGQLYPHSGDLRIYSPNDILFNNVGNVGIGTTAPGYDLDVAGLGNFNNFVYGLTPVETDDYALATVEYVNSATSGSGVATFSASTAGTYNGGQSGYTTANTFCNTADPGSHVCTTDEILYTINSGATANIPINTTFWISNGPPAYTANANDCQGWTSSASSDYGTVWIKLASGDGFGALNKCNVTYKFACCK